MWKEHKEEGMLYIFSNGVLPGNFAKIWWEGIATTSHAQAHNCKFNIITEAALEDQMQR